MTIRNYDCPDFSRKAPAANAPAVQPYEETHFQSHKVSPEVVDSVHKKDSSFKLDTIVVEQLGLEQRERAAVEERVRKEIERRWEQASEKAEVNGYAKGLNEGKAEAYKAELPRIQERVAKLDALLQDFDKYREKIFTANEAFLMELIAEIAGMVVLKEVEIDKDYVRRLVITLLQQLGTKDDIKIHLSETDFANVEVLKQALDKEFGKLNNTTIEVSGEVPVGGCKIETRFGVVDASIAAQIENVKKTLKA
ncbi:MAG TPA: FliH/SctL family protein [Bdellovibrionota bacterium]|jgi:flagellar assembly protein FliH